MRINYKILACALLVSFSGSVEAEILFSDNNPQNELINSNQKENKMTQNNYREVHAKHILVDTESEAKQILQKINDNEISFEDAAMQSSKCPSKNSGGDLGFFGRGTMVKEFEDAAFETEKGKVSEPVKTQFGWHLIKVIDKR